MLLKVCETPKEFSTVATLSIIIFSLSFDGISHNGYLTFHEWMYHIIGEQLHKQYSD
jgi:hypothetical protein